MSLIPAGSRRQVSVPRRAAATKTHTIHTMPAPNKGLDVTQQLVGSDPLTAIRLENLIPRVFGCELRRGYSRHVSNLDGEVRTLMPYISPSGTKALFAGTSAGSIYDVTTAAPSSTVPTPLVDAEAIGTIPGQWSYVNFTNDFGSYLLACSAGTGYWIYEPSAGWTKVLEGTAAGDIEGTDPIDFDFVFVWKARVWFLAAGSSTAWYLPVNQITGKVTSFNFGPVLPNGGALCFGTNWTVDGGEGIDDKIVLASYEGDIVIYSGTDPDEASTFQMDGRWFVGHFPAGRRSFARFSSDLMMLSERGLVFLTELLRGKGFFENAQIAQRINPQITQLLSRSMDQKYWEVRFLPHEQLIIINVPTSITAFADEQVAYEVNTQAFCNLTGMPMLTVEFFDRATYSGDIYGNVWLCFNGESDGKIDDVPGKDLQGAVVSAFQPFGEGVRLKRFLMVRPSFIAKSAPAVKLTMNPDWSFKSPKGAPNFAPRLESAWDIGQWDVSSWGGTDSSFAVWVGVNGVGYYGALSMLVSGAPGTTFVSWQALVEPGGVL